MGVAGAGHEPGDVPAASTPAIPTVLDPAVDVEMDVDLEQLEADERGALEKAGLPKDDHKGRVRVVQALRDNRFKDKDKKDKAGLGANKPIKH